MIQSKDEQGTKKVQYWLKIDIGKTRKEGFVSLTSIKL